ncbi:hypothetical protein HELRODRAFT_162439 [Helobdella robusta]|uniref:RRM domain-containing protein n=1 Tax=Helobdella robusta TaxID=6412 RepID=T1ESN3_HELRO|nr:hypothetical protein HELRODRAFT_162439 [Helobdella robusta]ESN98966.1 hypothetical protein HELRODRAFT_162439 [Helobdella robusta]
MPSQSTNNPGECQLLIQYATKLQAQKAKMMLDGHSMFPGCNKLKVEYSSLSDIDHNLSYSQQNSRMLESNSQPLSYVQTSIDLDTLIQQQQQQQQQQLQLQSLQHLQLQQQHSQQQSQQQFSIVAPSTALIQAPATQVAEMVYSTGARAGGSVILAATSTALLNVGHVVLVSNLDEEKVNPDALFTLFGVYGDVIKVKIMFNKKDTALIQFNDPMQAQTAMLNLDKLKLWGKVIKVTPSKHTIVQMPKDGQFDINLTKDYTNSTLHRFKKPNSKNYNNIFPPAATLHLSNIPSTSKETLVALFSKHGTVVGFKFFTNVVSANKDCKMALMQMSSIEEAAWPSLRYISLIDIISLLRTIFSSTLNISVAISCVCVCACVITRETIRDLLGEYEAMHNYQLAETTHLRVSFSKSGYNIIIIINNIL